MRYFILVFIVSWKIISWYSSFGLIFLFVHSVQFSCSVMSNSLWPHELQHARPPCPSPTPGVYPNPCSLSWWCHPTISSSVVPFSSCPQSFPASGSFPMSQVFASAGQIIGVSASASVLPMNTQDWSPLGWTGWISLQSKGLSRVFSNTTVKYIKFSFKNKLIQKGYQVSYAMADAEILQLLDMWISFRISFSFRIIPSNTLVVSILWNLPWSFDEHWVCIISVYYYNSLKRLVQLFI